MKTEKVIPFKDTGQISQELLYRMREKGMTYGLKKITPLSTEDIVTAEWVNLKCRYGCNHYNTNWCCPPATPDTEKARAILKEYSLGILLKSHHSFPEFYLNNSGKRTKQVHHWKGTVSLERLLFLEGFYKAFSLISGPCALCKECQYPESCRFPQERRPSVESFSIDMLGTLQRIGEEPHVANDKMQSFSSYSIILAH
jgi:predicted metal-binding protein